MKHPLIDGLDLRSPVVDPWDFPRFPRRLRHFIETGELVSEGEAQITHVLRDVMTPGLRRLFSGSVTVEATP